MALTLSVESLSNTTDVPLRKSQLVATHVHVNNVEKKWIVTLDPA